MTGQPRAAILVAENGNEEDFKNTVNSLKNQDQGFGECLQILTVKPDPSVWKGYENAFPEVKAPYLMMIRAGDTFLPDALIRGCAFFDTRSDVVDAVMFRGSYEGRKQMPKQEKDVSVTEGMVFSLEEETQIKKIPNCYEGILLRTEAVVKEHFCESNGYETKEELIYRILFKKKRIGYVRQAVILVNGPIKRSAVRNKDNIKKDWYLNTAKEHLLPLTVKYADDAGNLPLFIQYRIVYELKLRFESNRSQDDKHALNEKERDEFFALCGELLRKVDDRFLTPNEETVYAGELSYPLSKMFLDLKYGEDGHPSFYPDNRVVQLDLTNYQEKKLILDFSCAPFAEDEKLTALWNKKEIPVQQTVRYDHTSYFGVNVYKRDTFRLEFSDKQMKAQKQNILTFVWEKDGRNIPLQMQSGRFTSRISSGWSRSYWCFGSFLICFRGKPKQELVIESGGVLRHLKRELKLLLAMKKGNPKEQEMYEQRLLYWRSWPKYHKKNIWLTFDKIYKGGDNGEYFYKYMMTRKDTDVVPAYLINEDAPDRKRLEKEGYTPLLYGTRKHREMFLHAKMIFATHAGIYNFNHISEEELPYLQDLMNADAICIQHGLTVQDLTFNANRAFNNNKRYYCASKYEVENLRKPLYGYEDPEMIRLTGLPRYDGLVNRDQKQILITPTWRSYIALPAPEKNNTRPYFEGFKETDYFKVYNRLISDKTLLKTAEETGYKVVFLVHPNISEQAVDFTKNKGVEIIPAVEVDYEKILTESSLMVTDYSGVQFDFAYMRKPLVYYHPPKLPPHYVEGGFFYDTQGFGEICREHEELVDTLCGYMRQGCRVKEFYEARENDFFAFRDHENCKRIFEDAWEYQHRGG